jgi:hypothetical protein
VLHAQNEIEAKPESPALLYSDTKPGAMIRENERGGAV